VQPVSPALRDRPVYDAHRVLARPCLHPVRLDMELINHP
jgi:hypothetical protein